MLKKRQRLSRKEFSHIIKHGKRLHNEHLSFVFLEGSPAKYGLVVSKKVAKQATLRNKLRRQIYAVLGEHLPSLQNINVVVLTKHTVKNLSFSEIKKSIESLIEKQKSVRGNNSSSKVEYHNDI